MKKEIFKKELDFIKDDSIKNYIGEQIEKLPDYFFVAPASSSGKYHPGYALGKGGLVRHVKAAVYIATELFRMKEYNFPQETQDIIIGALLLHDGRKSGNSNEGGHSVANHPVLQIEFMEEDAENHPHIEEEKRKGVESAILTHMGQWNTEWNSKKILMPKPKSKIQKFVHLCDYLASRKMMEFNFGRYDREYSPESN